MMATAPQAVLCADDYALTDGVSRGIEDLARAGRLSATSALVTTRHWPRHGNRVEALRRHVQVGVHLNLTLGAPLGPLTRLAPHGRFPAVGTITARALAGRLDRAEIEAEFARQIEAFRTHAGRDPDFLDGHQHVHALPVVRAALLAVLAEVFPAPARRPWVRDPGDTAPAILTRGAAVPKALALATLAQGFGRAVRRAGFATNRGFAGVSAFNRAVPFEREFVSFCRAPGPRHLIMCHPGHVDDELRSLDPVVERRADEFEALMASPSLPSWIVTGGDCWPAHGSEAAA